MNNVIYEDYKDIEDIINENYNNRNDLSKTDVYQTLMNKEEKIIDVLNNMSNYKQKKDSTFKYLISSPLNVIVMKVFYNINDLIEDLYDKRNINEIIDTILKKDRLVYVGIFVVVIALLLLLVFF
jgi:hypothetical protein